MDFSLDEELLAVRGLAGEILADHTTPARLRAAENSATRLDPELWKELARAGLLGLELPEEVGGAGLGPGADCVLLEEQGRWVAPVPLWSALTAASAVAAEGSDEQRVTLLPPVAGGESRLTVALEEFAPADPTAPGCRAEPAPDPSAGGWRLSGTKAAVPAPVGAAGCLVTATTPGGSGLFLIDIDAPGADWQTAETTAHERAAHLTLRATPAQRVGAPGTGAVERTVRRAALALSAAQLGVAQGALRYAADYLGSREQFGRPLAAFQAVQHQLADCYTEIDAMRVTLWQAVCSAAQTRPTGLGGPPATTTPTGHGAADPWTEAARASLVARWWASEAGLNVVHRVQHLHGGIGVDTDYPVHRYFLWGKQLAGTLEGASATLSRLGALLAGPAVTP